MDPDIAPFSCSAKPVVVDAASLRFSQYLNEFRSVLHRGQFRQCQLFCRLDSYCGALFAFCLKHSRFAVVKILLMLSSTVSRHYLMNDSPVIAVLLGHKLAAIANMSS